MVKNRHFSLVFQVFFARFSTCASRSKRLVTFYKVYVFDEKVIFFVSIAISGKSGDFFIKNTFVQICVHVVYQRRRPWKSRENFAIKFHFSRSKRLENFYNVTLSAHINALFRVFSDKNFA